MCRDDWRNVPFYEASRTRTYKKTKKTGNEAHGSRGKEETNEGKTMAAPLPVII